MPEEEENFDEAIKAVNTALVPTRVIYNFITFIIDLFFSPGYFNSLYIVCNLK